MRYLEGIAAVFFISFTFSCSNNNSVLYTDTYWEALYGYELDGSLGQYLAENNISVSPAEENRLNSNVLKNRDKVFITPGVDVSGISGSNIFILKPDHNHWQKGWQNILENLEAESCDIKALVLYDSSFLRENFGISKDLMFPDSVNIYYIKDKKRWNQDEVTEILNENEDADCYYFYFENVLKILTLLKDQEKEIHVAGVPYIYTDFKASVYSLLPDWKSLIMVMDYESGESSAKEVILEPLDLKNRKRKFIFMNLVEKIKNR